MKISVLKALYGFRKKQIEYSDEAEEAQLSHSND